MVAGREVSPQDVQDTERLKRYWKEHIAWGHPGDYMDCVIKVTAAVKGRMTPEQIKGYCANLHKEATGGWPGHAPAEEALRKSEQDTKRDDRKHG